jgi:tetratricopeptide (TPR) repeat protein
MKKSIKSIALLTIINMTMTNVANADMGDDLLKIQQRWAVVNYQLSDDSQEKAFEDLIGQVTQFNQQYEKDAESYIWAGIIKSSYAGAKGGLGALSLAKQSKKLLEQAIEINDKALNGSAYTSLATLYSQVPGWPIGFGNDKKAEKHFTKALEINPEGIDPNYFYAQYLYQDKAYKAAKKHLEIAQQAQPRQNRMLADSARQKEISQWLVKVNKKLKKRR